RYVHIVEVTGSNPVSPTILPRNATQSEKYLDRKLAEISTVHVNHEQTKEEAKSNIIYGTQAFTRYAAVVNNNFYLTPRFGA
ncbi:MAG TPA: hypothetical protein PLN88_08035, partial [Candidatus Cloacimonadota bacterium]|nr:hypothetical protein [Candidatus Cloacimonadota bacterium]